MAKTILQQLYGGEIYPAETINPKDPEYRAACRQIGEEKEHFMNTLTPEEKERFERLYTLYEDKACVYSYENFLYGFQLGIHLMAETLVCG